MKRSIKSNKMPVHSWTFEALGTSWQVETGNKLDDLLKKYITQHIEEFDRTYSRFRDDSLVSKLRTPGEYIFPDNIMPILLLYKTLYDLTDKRMTPLIGSMLEQAGYDAAYSFKKQKLHSTPPFESLGWDGGLMLRPTIPAVLDIGAAGKGRLVDEIADIFEQHHIDQYMIDASGDIKQKGIQERIGLEHPGDTTKIIGVANIKNQSICASAINRRSWGDLHHIFDPLSKKPVDDVVATWVISKEAMIADGLATALFFIEPSVLLGNFKFTYVIIRRDGTIDYSTDFDGELFI